MKGKSESEVAQSCLTLSDPMDRSLPGSSVHGSLQARVLEWSAISFSKGHFRKDQNSTCKGPNGVEVERIVIVFSFLHTKCCPANNRCL